MLGRHVCQMEMFVSSGALSVIQSHLFVQTKVHGMKFLEYLVVGFAKKVPTFQLFCIELCSLVFSFFFFSLRELFFWFFFTHTRD